MFKLSDKSTAARVFQPEFYFTPTKLFPPFSQADQAFAESGAIAKPAVERDHPAYRYTENTLQAFTGSHGSITGTLSHPEIKADFMLDTQGSQMKFPAGTLNVEEGRGNIDYTPAKPLHLFITRGYATGMLDVYDVAAEIDNADLLQENGQMPVHFSTVSAPTGTPPLEDKDIAMRLMGISDLSDVLQGKQQLWSPIYRIGQNYIVTGPMAQVAHYMGLDTFNMNMITGQFPEATATTQEFGQTKWSAFRLGTSRVLTNPPTWKLWFDYRLPDTRFLRNLSIRLQTDQQPDTSVNLRYQWEFLRIQNWKKT